jgi:ABC-type methionine transport system ATPase subunit
MWTLICSSNIRRWRFNINRLKRCKFIRGQKQRISIARALYANADIYLIDDCLSALDSYVGKNIFHNVLRKYLHSMGKTVIFVTNAIDYTDYCDRVLVMK